jgi:hypothetical protein
LGRTMPGLGLGPPFNLGFGLRRWLEEFAHDTSSSATLRRHSGNDSPSPAVAFLLRTSRLPGQALPGYAFGPSGGDTHGP